MSDTTFSRMLDLFTTDVSIEETVTYLAEQLSGIVKKQEAVLVCFPRGGQRDLGGVLEKAILRCEGQPVFWESGNRWMDLLRLAFVSRATTVIGPPLTVLGLSKIAVNQSVPLYIYNTILTGYPCTDWMMDGIVKGLDSKIWGMFSPGVSAMISGFSCGCERGIHVWEDKFGADIVDEEGNVLPAGGFGRIVFYPRKDPSIRFTSKTFARIDPTPCSCGKPGKLVGMSFRNLMNSKSMAISQELLSWGSILDCKVENTPSGLAIEIVRFQGEKLPKLPTCARLVVRDFDPLTDVPFEFADHWFEQFEFDEKH